MPKTIDVPEFITRQQYGDLIAAVGLRPEDLTQLRFGGDGIYASVIYRDSEGRSREDGVVAGEELKRVVHDIYIPVVDEEGAR